MKFTKEQGTEIVEFLELIELKGWSFKFNTETLTFTGDVYSAFEKDFRDKFPDYQLEAQQVTTGRQYLILEN